MVNDGLFPTAAEIAAFKLLAEERGLPATLDIFNFFPSVLGLVKWKEEQADPNIARLWQIIAANPPPTAWGTFVGQLNLVYNNVYGPLTSVYEPSARSYTPYVPSTPDGKPTPATGGFEKDKKKYYHRSPRPFLGRGSMGALGRSSSTTYLEALLALPGDMSRHQSNYVNISGRSNSLLADMTALKAIGGARFAQWEGMRTIDFNSLTAGIGALRNLDRMLDDMPHLEANRVGINEYLTGDPATNPSGYFSDKMRALADSRISALITPAYIESLLGQRTIHYRGGVFDAISLIEDIPNITAAQVPASDVIQSVLTSMTLDGRNVWDLLGSIPDKFEHNLDIWNSLLLPIQDFGSTGFGLFDKAAFDLDAVKKHLALPENGGIAGGFMDGIRNSFLSVLTLNLKGVLGEVGDIVKEAIDAFKASMDPLLAGIQNSQTGMVNSNAGLIGTFRAELDPDRSITDSEAGVASVANSAKNGINAKITPLTSGLSGLNSRTTLLDTNLSAFDRNTTDTTFSQSLVNLLPGIGDVKKDIAVDNTWAPLSGLSKGIFSIPLLGV